MKGDEHATLEKPPNHKLFSVNNASISPVLQRRMDSAKNSATTSAPPVFNITIGREISELFMLGCGHAAQNVIISGPLDDLVVNEAMGLGSG
jgi:hypothetical protein